MTRTRGSAQGVAATVSAGVLIAAVLLLPGCTKPPSALPRSVIAEGADALPEKHPKLTDQQREKCVSCHREVPDPTGANP